jgi:hypothetical protein
MCLTADILLHIWRGDLPGVSAVRTPRKWLGLLYRCTLAPQSPILCSVRAIKAWHVPGVHDVQITAPGHVRMGHERDMPEMQIREDCH